MRLAKILGAASLVALATAAHAQDPELLVFDYPAFEAPGFHQPYIDKYGVAPTFAFFGDEEEAFQRLNAGFQTDVTHICAGTVPLFTEGAAHLIEPWDTSRIEAFGSLNADLLGTNMQADGDLFFLPTDFGTSAIAYNPEQVPEEDVASLSVFHNPAYAGRMTIPDNVDDAYALAYLATGVTDWTNATPEQFEAASNWLREAHPNLRTYWVDPSELAQLMASGEILVSWAWNETFPTMVAEGRPIGFQREPVEGSSLWLCGYLNMANGPGSEDKAYDYLNAFLSPASTSYLVGAGFAQSNTVGMEGITEEELTAGGIGEIDAPILAQLPMTVEQRALHAETFEMIKAGF
ncbi:ABC transporter substrate-binding protein [Ketogulonicigenium vulgare]|uniref:ABC polyamine transporter, periplasmic substrate-binding protein n=1 Tax=Ketogulonicigenium vulgare (strain WSH-001) TaxID=759362 RepID=F9Y6T6_KETVW|nr:ABC transporter substrate-binding protein [Ketogulonicigenium vulgare]ADO42767.1 ABC polyamine transporter, periplasmic substrate-binding protein [Ketogulonicigenium vulgare Y25]AEM40953.1 ABC polyamine transporter, periplasmic substrate-binding protein [Ketogulonicigenium vulgare WSH-001]ALJ81105.1 polyamine ABC transporter substrate-binding protein [Ketogulonicigenium vulgare]ANW33855.1 polyamine ABC transporter substrate-binding protein [Ketogulonicigenium vulgare]AOZ54678.1 polyamine AB